MKILEPVSRLSLRNESKHDDAFLEALYSTTRTDELKQVQWSDQEKRRFVSQQFHAQRTHYREHYPDAEFLVVEHDGEAVGRLYVHQARSELRLMDILLLPEWRGRGLGTRLLAAVLRRAAAAVVPGSVFDEFDAVFT
jgi:GNAT superfamily N-acetyltransferase